MPLLALASIAGSYSGSLLSNIYLYRVIAFALFFILALGSVYIRKIRFFSSFVCSFLIFAILSSINMYFIDSTSSILNYHTPTTCTAVVRAMPVQRPNGMRMDVDLLNCDSCATESLTHGGIRAYFKKYMKGILPGDVVLFKARFFHPREYKNPGDFSYGSYLHSRDIVATAYIYGKPILTGDVRGYAVRRFFAPFRNKIVDSASSVLKGDDLAVALALSIGDRSRIGNLLRQKFASIGIAHLLAISGLHVGLVAAILYFIIKFMLGFFPSVLLRFPIQRLSAGISIVAIWIYIMFVGSSVSAVRAGIMISVYMFGVMMGRRQDLLTTLAIAVIMILSVSPLAIYDVSFQLSVASVFGIILFMPLFSGYSNSLASDSFLSKIKKWIVISLAITISAMLWSSPFATYHFNMFAPAGLIVNLFAVPAVSFLLLPIIILASLSSLVMPHLSLPVWTASGFLIGHFLDFVNLAYVLTKKFIIHASPVPLEMMIVYAALFLVVMFKKRKLLYLIATLIIFSAVFDAAYWHLFPKFDEGLKIYAFDAGRDDFILIRFPEGKTAIIDGRGVAGDFDVGRRVIAPVLWRMGIHNLDFAVLTNPCANNRNTQDYLFNQFRPKILWSANSLPLGRSLIRNINGVQLSVSLSGTVNIEYAARRAMFIENSSYDDDAGRKKIGIKSRVDIIATGFKGAPKELLKTIEPEFAIISGDGGNYRLHNDLEIAERFEDAGAETYGTKLDGMVKLLIGKDGSIKISTYAGGL